MNLPEYKDSTLSDVEKAINLLKRVGKSNTDIKKLIGKYVFQDKIILSDNEIKPSKKTKLTTALPPETKKMIIVLDVIFSERDGYGMSMAKIIDHCIRAEYTRNIKTVIDEFGISQEALPIDVPRPTEKMWFEYHDSIKDIIMSWGNSQRGVAPFKYETAVLGEKI